MNGVTLLAALLASMFSVPQNRMLAVPPNLTPWSYYCWEIDPIPHPPTFKIAIQGVRGRGHSWLMTWKDWQAEAATFEIDAKEKAGDTEGITWLAKGDRRQTGRIDFSGPFSDGMPRLLTIKFGEGQAKSEVFTCIPGVLAVRFSPEERPDF